MTRKQKYKAYDEILIYFKEIHNLILDMCSGHNCKKCDNYNICLSFFRKKQPKQSIMALKRKYR